MTVFITSIRHPQNSANYDKIEQLLEKTLGSVCTQTDGDFAVVVVCNRIPRVPAHPKVHYVAVDFPPPSTVGGPQTGIQAVLKDKGSKYVIGLKKAEEFKPAHVMFFDADDFIHEGIAEYTNAHPTANGWYINQGYAYRDGGLLVSKVNNFNEICGTSNIFRFDLARITDKVTVGSSQEEVMALVDNEFLLWILGDHQKAVKWFQDKKIPLEPFPFRASIWVTNTGENHSGVSFFGYPQVLTSAILKKFHFEVTKGPRSGILRTLFFYYPYGVVRAILRNIKHLLKKNAG